MLSEIHNITFFILINVILFTTGVIGLVFNRKNILIVVMSIELLLLSINLNFVIFSLYLDDIVGQVFVLFILVVAATESTIGLAIIVVYYRIRNTVSLENISGYFKK